VRIGFATGGLALPGGVRRGSGRRLGLTGRSQPTAGLELRELVGAVEELHRPLTLGRHGDEPERLVGANLELRQAARDEVLEVAGVDQVEAAILGRTLDRSRLRSWAWPVSTFSSSSALSP
jgi:hypothetical protein